MNEHATHAPYDVPIAILAEDIDVLGHVNNVVYVRWVQDAAVAHWQALATPEEQREVVWVVVRHEIDYRHAALREDAIVARTWVGGAARHTFERHTEIRRGADGKLLARARTLWCPLDPKTGRPHPVSAGLRARFSVKPAESDAAGERS
jgi:acyl-CoA thioester hydrolase